MNHRQKPIVAISVGDPNGIGSEIIIKTLARKDINRICTPVIFCTYKLWSYFANNSSVKINYSKVTDINKIRENRINIVDIEGPDVQINYGHTDAAAGELSFASLEAATNAVTQGFCDVLVTAPINKANIQSEAFKFPGHTEYLEKSWGGEALMFMVHEDIKVGLVTQHIPLKEVAKNITQESIIKKVDLMHNSLKKDYQIAKPKIAILALNPHAGDNQLLGKEEHEIIIPAIKKMLDQGKYVFGAFPSDSFFTPQQIRKYDAILAMYHDQGLTSFKTLAGIEGVNYTAGLKHVRTSPDHGVGYDIAGTDSADETSMVEAVYTAVQIYERRKETEGLEKNAMKKPVRKETTKR